MAAPGSPIASRASLGSVARLTSRKELPLEQVETLEETLKNGNPSEQDAEEPSILEDICVEELAIDGICGVY